MKQDTHALRALIKHRQKLGAKVHGFKVKKRLPKPLRPLKNKVAYYKFLIHLIGELKSAVDRHVTPRLPTMLSQATRNHPVRNDDLDDDLDDAIDAAKEDFDQENSQKKLAAAVLVYFAAENSANKKTMQNTVKAGTGMDITFEDGAIEEYLQTLAIANSRLITKMVDDTLDQIAQRVFDAFRSGLRPEALAVEIADRFDVADSRASLIARDQMSKLNSGLDRMRTQELGLDRYTWRGVDDNRERDSHRENNNEVFSYDDPPVETGNPGDDVNCRCWAEPYFADLGIGLGEDDQPDDSQI